MKRVFLIALVMSLPFVLSAQGKLTAYYANTAFGDYQEGQLIVDTNDPINRMVDFNESQFKYEGDESGGYYSQLIPKSQVTVKEYQMTPLPVELVRDDAIFVSNDGFIVAIFAAHAGEHGFYSYDDDFVPYYDAEQTMAHQEYYAISGVLKSPYDPEGFFFEEPLEVEDDNIKLYVDGAEIRYVSVDDPDYVRYRPYKMGFLEEQWTKPDDYDYDKSAYDLDGNLVTDLMRVVDIPTYLSIAYIGDKDALYINGTLYYRQINDENAPDSVCQ
ncbi:MAG: hypothetical protein IKX18_04415 [Muribaculaceae bacterium]|nr:hypothetical protein [Muribaculaceae bacterium]MBR5685380.1 hypothetical protein [Muribaculaceae bacterium]